MREWAALHQHSDFSILDGLTKPTRIIERCVDVGIKSVALTDHGSLSGTVAFLKAKKTVIEKYQRELKRAELAEEKDVWESKIAATKSLKQILGSELYLCKQDTTIHDKSNRKNSHLVVLAKNHEGWKSLVQLSSASFLPENYYYKPRLNLEKLVDYTKGNLLCFSGHIGSDLANCLFTDIDLAYKSRTYDEAKSYIDPEWKKKAYHLIGKYQEIFGKENFYIEIQLIDQDNFPAAKIVGKALRFIANKSGVPAVATADSHYATHEDAQDQLVLLCKNTTLRTVMREMEDEDAEVGLAGFFRSNNYHIPNFEEMNAIHTEDELANALQIADMCETYDIMHRPSVPKFSCPNELNADDYLRNLCRIGYKQKIKGKTIAKYPEEVYVNRIKEELSVISSAEILSDYFLVVQDYASAARARGEFVGPGRGSGGGCLISYLIGITGIDPIAEDLSFVRFYNAGRNTADRISLPDIDCDFPTNLRYKTIEYIREKYGREHVCQMGTFQRMMGKAAIRNVLRVHEACGASESDKICEFIPEPAAISDQLQLMIEAGNEPSVLMWSLQNYSKELKDWCYIDEKDGLLKGQFAKYFSQAIRLEGVKQSTGKHPSGIVIADFILSDRIPMMRDKSSNEQITAIEMNDVEALGGAKFDILGVASLDKIMGVQSLLATGKLYAS